MIQIFKKKLYGLYIKLRIIKIIKILWVIYKKLEFNGNNLLMIINIKNTFIMMNKNGLIIYKKSKIILI